MEIPLECSLSDEDRPARWPTGVTCLFVLGASSILWTLIIGGVRWLMG